MELIQQARLLPQAAARLTEEELRSGIDWAEITGVAARGRDGLALNPLFATAIPHIRKVAENLGGLGA